MIVMTGASDGLGLAVAKLLVARGEDVICLSRRKPKIKGVQHIAADLNSEGSINAAAAQLLAMGKPMSALVNCAGIFSEEPSGALTGAEVARTFTTNAIGPLLLVSRLLERIKQDGADIVNVISTAGTKPAAGQIAYGSSKWAARGMSQTLQAELKDTSCRVVTFCPGGMRTNFFKKYHGKALPDPQNWMDPADVAAFLVHILALPKSMEISEVVINRKIA